MQIKDGENAVEILNENRILYLFSEIKDGNNKNAVKLANRRRRKRQDTR